MTTNGNMTGTTSTERISLDGFRKVGIETCGSLVHVTMWNPETKTSLRVVVEDYEYQYPDGPFMAGSIREYGLDEVERIHDAPVDEDALRDFNIHYGIIFKGAEVEVLKGRKVPVGVVGTVFRIRDIHDRYGRHIATYADFKTAEGVCHSTNIANLRVIG